MIADRNTLYDLACQQRSRAFGQEFAGGINVEENHFSACQLNNMRHPAPITPPDKQPNKSVD
jgi:hypothetical protein